MQKRIVSLFLCAALLFGLLPAGVFAQDPAEGMTIDGNALYTEEITEPISENNNGETVENTEKSSFTGVSALLADENMLFKCADIRQLLKRLEDYTTMHFTHEEKLMEEMSYGGIEEQKKQHRMFVQKLEEFTDRVSKLSLGTQDAMIQDLFEYLQQWLQDHIKVEDMKYARFAMEKTKGDC